MAVSSHAVRNASGAGRWMACPGSIRLEHGRPNSSSEAAQLGTAAHALGEKCLQSGCDASDWLDGFIRLDAAGNAELFGAEFTQGREVAPIEPGLVAGWQDFCIDANMADAVQVYLDAVRGELKRLGHDAELHVEERFDLSWLVGYDFDEAEEALGLGSYVSPSGIRRTACGALVHASGKPCYGPMFGTNDSSVVLVFEHISVFDYKHGQGVVVEVENNVQLLYYALGCAHEMSWAFATLDIVVVQPRAMHQDGPVRRWRTDKAELKAFESRLREAAQATERPDAPLLAGSHCQFCRAAGVCPELRAEAFRQAGVDFGDGIEEPSIRPIGPEESDEDLAVRIAAIPLLDCFIKAAQAEAVLRLLASDTGEACFGKLVQRRSNRVFRSDLTTPTGEAISVVDELVKAGIPREMLFEEPKPKTPARVEAVRPPELMAQLKARKVKAPAAYIKALVAQYTYRPENGVAFVPLSDTRKAVPLKATDQSDFEEAHAAE